jgi:hypothetical protein
MSTLCYVLIGVFGGLVTILFVCFCCQKNNGNGVAGNTGAGHGDLTVWSVSAGVADGGGCGGDGGACGGDGG